LRAENADRPDYLENIFAPPLAPGGQCRSLESIVTLTYSWSMIFSKNRFPLFRIML